MKLRINKLVAACLGGIALAGCSAGGDYPGTEYAPQMYHSVAYEPLTQLTPESLEEQDHMFYSYYQGMMNSMEYGHDTAVVTNSLLPVEGTVKRQNYMSVTHSSTVSNDQALLVDYKSIHPDSFNTAAEKLISPYTNMQMSAADADELLSEGKDLYGNYCGHCHGAGGEGDGKVADKYAGVANLVGNAVKGLKEGHIFHVITHGKGNMWPHKSHLNPEERWKIVYFIKNELHK